MGGTFSNGDASLTNNRCSVHARAAAQVTVAGCTFKDDGEALVGRGTELIQPGLGMAVTLTDNVFDLGANGRLVYAHIDTFPRNQDPAFSETKTLIFSETKTLNFSRTEFIGRQQEAHDRFCGESNQASYIALRHLAPTQPALVTENTVGVYAAATLAVVTGTVVTSDPGQLRTLRARNDADMGLANATVDPL